MPLEASLCRCGTSTRRPARWDTGGLRASSIDGQSGLLTCRQGLASKALWNMSPQMKRGVWGGGSRPPGRNPAPVLTDALSSLRDQLAAPRRRIRLTHGFEPGAWPVVCHHQHRAGSPVSLQRPGAERSRYVLANAPVHRVFGPGAAFSRQRRPAGLNRLHAGSGRVGFAARTDLRPRGAPTGVTGCRWSALSHILTGSLICRGIAGSSELRSYHASQHLHQRRSNIVAIRRHIPSLCVCGEPVRELIDLDHADVNGNHPAYD